MRLGGLVIECRVVESRTGDNRKAHMVLDQRSVAQLEIVLRFTPGEGSNPSLSAKHIAMARLLRNDLKSLFACRSVI